MRATIRQTRTFAVRGGSIAGKISPTFVSTHGQFSCRGLGA